MAHEPHQESRFKCVDCNSSFSCRHLLTALTILEGQVREHPDPRLIAFKERVARDLAALGWQFPEGKSPCALHGREDLTRELTEEIIAMLEEAGAKGGRPGDKGTLYREVIRG